MDSHPKLDGDTVASLQVAVTGLGPEWDNFRVMATATREDSGSGCAVLLQPQSIHSVIPHQTVAPARKRTMILGARGCTPDERPSSPRRHFWRPPRCHVWCPPVATMAEFIAGPIFAPSTVSLLYCYQPINGFATLRRRRSDTCCT